MILRLFICAILQFCIIGLTFGVVPQITRLNVQCDRSGMKVMVEFDNTFNGIIFSKGHFSDPNCRYVNAAGGQNIYEFSVSSSSCGTMANELIATTKGGNDQIPQGFKNVIIIQNDPDYQEVWDSARRLSCDWVTRLEKTVTFAPFGVDMLGVKELRFPGDTVDCWMDIQRGHGPFAPTIGGVVPIGEKLTVVIYVRDSDKSFDVHVKDCYAYDTPDYRNPNAHAIKLTDENGCPLKEKLVQGFFRTRDVRNSGATIIAYGIINAFKFPEKMDVFLACNVEVCKGGCMENVCQPIVDVAGQDSVASDDMASSDDGGTELATVDTTSTDEATTSTESPAEDGDDGDSATEEEEKKEETPSDGGDEEETTPEDTDKGGDDEEEEEIGGGDSENGKDVDEESNGNDGGGGGDDDEEKPDSESSTGDEDDEKSEDSVSSGESDSDTNGGNGGDEESTTSDDSEEKKEETTPDSDEESTVTTGDDEDEEKSEDSNGTDAGDSEESTGGDGGGDEEEEKTTTDDEETKAADDDAEEQIVSEEKSEDVTGDDGEETTNGDTSLSSTAVAGKKGRNNEDEQIKEGDEAEITNGDSDDDETEEERKKRRISASLKLKAKKSSKVLKSAKKSGKVKKLAKSVASKPSSTGKKPKVTATASTSSKLVRKPQKSLAKKPLAALRKQSTTTTATSSAKKIVKKKSTTTTTTTNGKKPTAAKLVKKSASKSSRSSSSARLVRKSNKTKGKVSRPIVNKKAGQLKARKASLPANRTAKIRRPSSSSSAKLIRPMRQIRQASSPTAIPIELRRLSATLQHPNAGIVQEGRHVRTRRSVLINDTSIMNATFAPMIHSIQIISPIEDFDEKELNAWEKLMQLEGSVEEEVVDNNNNNNDDDDEIHRIPSFTIATASITGQHRQTSLAELNGHHSYCFSRIHLITASLLLSSVTVILSMILYMICSYIHQRQQLVNDKIGTTTTTKEKISYFSYA
ncbi:uncharacterized protein LOC124490648 isoform X1 [Dermatophagoides farinae]|uniref:uncharacterized protein LOC124490648 isoform X1 n=1 Tax=Dermatophagoides farinae TaxID=6954 RepID=UPI003F5EB7C3